MSSMSPTPSHLSRMLITKSRIPRTEPYLLYAQSRIPCTESRHSRSAFLLVICLHHGLNNGVHAAVMTEQLIDVLCDRVRARTRYD